jgi:hypothetical protein
MNARLLAVLLAAFPAASLQAAPPLVHNPYPILVGGSPTIVVKGNFGGDAAEDLVVIESASSIRTLINVAGGPFSAAVTTQITDSVSAAAPGHFDADGFLDLAVVVPFDQVALYHGNGDGTFRKGLIVQSSNQVRGITVGDFNGDGHADVAVGNTYSSYGVTVHFGGGNGLLGPAIATTDVGSGYELVATDFNGDGKSDLVLCDERAVTVLIGLGNGRFNIAFSNWGGGGVAVGDFDHDAKVDVFFATDEYGTFHLRRGAGNGTFLPPAVSYRLIGKSVPQRVRAADVDGDGNLDVVGGGEVGPLAVLRGNGDGTFDAAEYWIADAIRGIVTGDFDRNGTLDIIYSSSWQGGWLFMVRGTGGGAFDAYRGYDVTQALPQPREVTATSAADMNGDGKPDLVAVVYANGASELVVFLNDGAGNWAAPRFTPLSTMPYGPQPAIGDVNGDGKLDVVVAGATHLGKGDGTFQAPAAFSFTGLGPTFLVDLNGDGKLDFIDSLFDLSGIYLGSGTGSFSFAGSVGIRVIGVADLTGDGRPDIIGAPNLGGGFTLVGINNGSGGFTVSTASPSWVSNVVALADFNGDGHADLLLDGGVIQTVFGRGDGTFGNAVTMRSNVEMDWRSIVADINGDGALDVVTGGSIVLGDGTGRFRSYASVRGGGVPSAVADFDGDGDLDLVVANGPVVALVRPNTGPDPLVTTTMTLAATPAAPRYGERVTYTATLSVPTVQRNGGALLYAEDGVPVELDVLYDHQSLNFETALRTGTHSATVTYSGDSHHSPVTRTVTHEVPRGLPELWWNDATRTCAAEIRIDIYVRATYAGLPGPSGDLTFRSGNTILPSRRSTSTVSTSYLVGGLGIGTHTVTAEYAGDANYEPVSRTFTQVVDAPYTAALIAGSGVYANEPENVASLAVSPFGIVGVTYTWSVTNATITSGQGTRRITYTAGASGEVTIQVTMAKPGTPCDIVRAATVSILERPPGASMFYTVTPCRLVDTRGGPALGGTAEMSVTVAGNCSVPAGAKSVAANVTVVVPATSGWMSLYPADLPWPGTSTVNYRAGKTRANNSIVPLSADGRIHVRNSGPEVHYLVDVYGYFK